MCGIVGYIGSRRNSIETLIEGLKRLEYRGYDSAGLAVIENNKIEVAKATGKVINLNTEVNELWENPHDSKAQIGIAHTRWATHGLPTKENCHPHIDQTDKFAIVHNGIIENYAAIKSQLQEKGYNFTSETDSEIITQLISEYYEDNLFDAVAKAVKQLEGTFGIVVMSLENPDTLIVVRRGSPIVIGVGKNETIIGSDIAALVAYTKRVIYLDDNDIATVTADGVDIRNIDCMPVSREVTKIDWDTESAEKQGYDHFMLKEIFEQPTAVKNSIRGRLDKNMMSASLGGLNLTPREMAQINRVIIAACGTSLHAGMLGDYYFADLATIPTEIQQAAEFRYRNPIIEPNSLVVAISQSGETADTLAAVKEAMNKGAIVASLCNVVGSTIARTTGCGVYLHAGPEIGVASTKAFTCQATVLLMMALKFGRSKRLSAQKAELLIKEIETIPKLIEEVLKNADDIAKVAKKYSDINSCFFIGRGYLYPVALEGALKLKEISYIHAEGYHAAELKHGPIALLEENVPVIALANDIAGKDKTIGNMQECRARKSPVIATATIGDTEIEEHADDILWVPKCSEFVTPIITVVALQLLSYYVAKERGCEIDQPRNLAKSVTVE